jgi:hypothetical protein
MIRSATIPCLLFLTGLAAAESPDLLRFTNGDQLHGTFLGIKQGPQAAWQREDVAAPVDFKTTQIRHIVLHGGRPLKPLGSLSHLGLVNGDRIPGTITGIDAETITLDTSYAGVLHIPRKQVSLMAPNPLGGRVYYHGPFIENEWKMIHSSYPDGMPAASPANKDKDAKDKDAKDKDAKDKDAKDKDAKDKDAKDEAKDKDGEENDGQEKELRPPEDLPGRWAFSGSAWYWKNKHAGTALIRETGMPDRAILRFDLAWKNRLCIAIAFHADFASPKRKEGEARKGGKLRGFIPGDAGDLPRLFGNSYVLQMYSNYMMLYRTAVNEDGKPSLDQIQINNNNLRLVETGDARVEIRSNRRNGSIALFINEEFVAQWSENEGVGNVGVGNVGAGNGWGGNVGPGNVGHGFAGKGAGFGFVVQGDDSPVRISDIVVSEWNGMPDSARSLQVDEQDVVLMANGTDRYAGRVGNLDEHGKVLFEGKHGQFQFPLDEVAEIRFARERLAPAPEDAVDNLCVRFSPIGSVTGHPLAGNGTMLGILSPCAGELNLSLDAAVMLDFNASKQIIDDWNAEF